MNIKIFIRFISTPPIACYTLLTLFNVLTYTINSLRNTCTLFRIKYLYRYMNLYTYNRICIHRIRCVAFFFFKFYSTPYTL